MKIYDPIDIHSKPKTPTWPEVIPELTAEEAQRAARRLFRWACGRTWEGKIEVTSGNRRNRITWRRITRVIIVNPSRGWRELVHDLSHWFDIYMNGETKHGKHHARLENKMIREVIKRGYLDGKLLKDQPDDKVVQIRGARIGEAYGIPTPEGHTDESFKAEFDETLEAMKEIRLEQRRQSELQRIQARLDRWRKKEQRAKRAIAKLTRRETYYTKALAA